jgi:hypothetical protein
MLGRFAEALEEYEGGLARMEKLRGRVHPDLVDALAGVGRALVGLGQAARAVPPLERAVEISAGEGVPLASAAESRFALAQALRATHTDGTRARSLAVLAAENYRRAGGDYAKRAVDVERWLSGAPR